MSLSPPPETYHLVAAPYFDSLNSKADYQPEAMAQDGFMHCTDGWVNVIATANRYYQRDPRPFYCLVINRQAVNAAIRYDDPAQIYPHIYGALNRDAILYVKSLKRAADGTFLAVME